MATNDRTSSAAQGHRPGYFRYSVGYRKRDWPFRPWRWKRVSETRYVKIGVPRAY